MAPLPDQFASLEPFVADWALPTEDERTRKRLSSSAAEHRAFYLAVLPRIDEILAYLGQYEPGAVPAEARALYHLAIAFAEASPHVEMYKGSAIVPNSFDAHRFVAAHGARPDN